MKTSYSTGTITDLADINPESLGVNTPPNFEFRYIDISSVTMGVIDWNSVTTQIFAEAPSRARRIVRPNDVLFCTVRPGLKAHAFAEWKDKDAYVCSTGFAVLRANKHADARFLYHLVFGEWVEEQVRQLEIGSNYPAINERDIRALKIPIPTLPEQHRIAEILDGVDATIQHTEAIISKLEQMKAGLLNDLMTCGFDKDGRPCDPQRCPERFKDSSLGSLPVEWQTPTFEEITPDNAPICYGLVQPGAFAEDGVPVLAIHNLNGDYVTNVHKSEQAIEQAYVRSRVLPNDILLSIKGTIGRTGLVPLWFKGNISRDLARIRLKPIASPYFVKQMLQAPAFQRRLELATVGTTRLEISIGVLKKFRLPLPLLGEQQKIAEILDTQDARIRAEEANRDKLIHLKRGLMRDLLTGCVRVNELKLESVAG